MAGYAYMHLVTIGDVNMDGTVYFAKYLEWFGRAREAMVAEHVSLAALRQDNVFLVTKSAMIAYKHELSLYDRVRILVSIGSLRPASAALFFRVLDSQSGEIRTIAKQSVCFADRQRKPIRVPDTFRCLPELYKEEAEKEFNTALRESMGMGFL